MSRATRPSICLNCIGDADLRDRLQADASSVRCKYCNVSRPGISVRDLAKHVDDTIRGSLRIGGISPRFTADSDKPHYSQEGDEIILYLQELLEIDLDAAEALLEELIDLDPADPRDGEDPFYATDQHYVRAEVGAEHFQEAWQAFADTLKHDQRFFGGAALETLSRILGARGSVEASELPTIVLGDGGEVAPIFRARRANSVDEARAFLAAPAKELAPPPSNVAAAGRMNPAGIAVFYGAMAEIVAIAEVRPAVGGFVVVGKFRTSKPLRILDLRRLGASFTGSVFAPQYFERVARAQFLRGFHRLITQPVQPHDEPLEYLPTQAVAEYVRNVLEFDGILFASTQVGTVDDDDWDDQDGEVVHPLGSHNVVVFGRTELRFKDVSWLDRRSAVREARYPVTLSERSAHGVRIRSVSYASHEVDLDDERGLAGMEHDTPF